MGAAPITTSTNTSVHQSQNEKDDPNILQVPPSSSAMSPTGSMSLFDESNESIWSWKSQSELDELSKDDRCDLCAKLEVLMCLFIHRRRFIIDE